MSLKKPYRGKKTVIERSRMSKTQSQNIEVKKRKQLSYPDDISDLKKIYRLPTSRVMLYTSLLGKIHLDQKKKKYRTYSGLDDKIYDHPAQKSVAMEI